MEISVWTGIMCILSIGTLCCAVQRIKSSKAKFWAGKQTCCSVFTHVAPADALRCRPCLVRGQAQRLRRNVYQLLTGSWKWLIERPLKQLLFADRDSGCVRVFCIIDSVFRTSPALEGRKKRPFYLSVWQSDTKGGLKYILLWEGMNQVNRKKKKGEEKALA